MMKTRLLFLLVILGHSHVGFTQEAGPQYTRFSIGLKGKVKELVSFTYGIRGEGSQQQSYKQYGYRFIYYPDGFIDSSFSAHLYDSLKWQFNYHYYWKGDTLCSTLHPENAWGKSRFNKEQLVIYQEFYSEKSMRQYIVSFYDYDTMGRPVRLFGPNDPPGKGVLYQYKKNQDGTFTQVRTDKPDPDYKIFNAKRQMISYVFFDNTNSGKTERQFFYNEQGDLLTEKEMMYKKEGGKWVPLSREGTTKTYRYLYDQQQNWISRESTYNGKSFEQEGRTITYWN